MCVIFIYQNIGIAKVVVKQLNKSHKGSIPTSVSVLAHFGPIF